MAGGPETLSRPSPATRRAALLSLFLRRMRCGQDASARPASSRRRRRQIEGAPLAKPAGAAACARAWGPAAAVPSGPSQERMRGPDRKRDLWRRLRPPVCAPLKSARSWGRCRAGCAETRSDPRRRSGPRGRTDQATPVIFQCPKAFMAWRRLNARIDRAASAFTALNFRVRNLPPPDIRLIVPNGCSTVQRLILIRSGSAIYGLPSDRAPPDRTGGGSCAVRLECIAIL